MTTEPEPDGAAGQTVFCLALPAPRDRRLAVGGGDEEVRRKSRSCPAPRSTRPPPDLHDPRRDLPGGLLQLLQGDSVHRVPEPAVVQRRAPILVTGPPRWSSTSPRTALSSTGRPAVQRRQRQVGPGGQRLPGRRGPAAWSMTAITPSSSSMPQAAAASRTPGAGSAPAARPLRGPPPRRRSERRCPGTVRNIFGLPSTRAISRRYQRFRRLLRAQARLTH